MKNTDRFAWGAFAAVTLMSFLLYAPHVLYGEWVYEDFFSSQSQGWISPQNAHLVGIGVHAMNSWLLAILICSLGYSFGPIAGMLMLFHPLSIESIAYANATHEVMAGAGVLLFLICALSGPDRWYVWRMVLGTAALAFAVSHRPTSIMVLPLVVWILLCNGILKRSVAFLGIAVAALAVLLYAKQIASHWEWQGSTMPMLRWVSVQSVGAWQMALTTLMPWHLSISHAYFDQPPMVQALALVGIPLSMWMAFQAKWRWLIFGVVGYWMLWIPRFVTRVPLGWIREHHAYQPMMILVVVMAAALSRLKSQHLVMPALALVLSFYGARDYVRLQEWQSDRALWTAAARTDPNDPWALTNAGHFTGDLNYDRRLLALTIPRWMGLSERSPYIVGYHNIETQLRIIGKDDEADQVQRHFDAMILQSMTAPLSAGAYKSLQELHVSR